MRRRDQPGRTAWLGLFVLATLLLPLLPLPGSVASEPECVDRHYRAGIGDSCVRPDGLLEVFATDGTSLGYTHGHDLIEDLVAPGAVGGPSFAGGRRTVDCVTATSTEYYVQIIYARAVTDFDGYAANLDNLRRWIEQLNGKINQAALDTGGTSDLKVRCVDGLIHVPNEVLTTPGPAASFSTITTELRNRGYNSVRVKYLVYYDDALFSPVIAGQGNLFGDDRPTANNNNNGNAGPMFAISYGRLDARVLLHELGHTLGAVQNSAPHTTGAGHCTDGRDTMCYNDLTGANSNGYSETICPNEIWDCNKDDYFNRNPTAGSYLAMKWNIGNAVDRFIEFFRPTVDVLDCPAVANLGEAITCSVRAMDDSTGVRYNIAWGDGASTCLPSCAAFTAPGTTQTASHLYAAGAAYTVTVTASDNGVPARISGVATIKVAIGDGTPPALTLNDPDAGSVYLGCVGTPGHGLTKPAYAKQACARGTAVDASSGLAKIEVFYNGVLEITTPTSPFTFQWPVTGPRFDQEVRVVATDIAGNVAETTVLVDILN